MCGRYASARSVDDLASTFGICGPVAVIGDRGSTGSIRVHEALGFQHAGVLEPVGYNHGRWLATVLMQRVLGAGEQRPPTTSVPD